jgi:hypothetical protein
VRGGRFTLDSSIVIVVVAAAEALPALFDWGCCFFGGARHLGEGLVCWFAGWLGWAGLGLECECECECECEEERKLR